MPILPLLLIFLCAFSAAAQDRVTGYNFATRSEVIAQNGLVATSHPLASQIALDILKQGGSAIDAAIAANAALGLMEPTGCGIGGDLFAIIWSAKDKKLYGLNGSGRSPNGMSIEYVKSKGLDKIPAFGPLSVTIPGAVDAWFTLHAKFGKLSFDKILAPSIDYAKNGYPITDLISYYVQASSKRFKDYPNFADVYMSNGQAPQKGDIVKNPALANTYAILAKEGRKGFYSGKMAQTMVDFLNSQGGKFTLADFEKHTSTWTDPVSTNYRGFDVWELPPNGQGIAALQILNILENYDIAALGFGSPEYIHLFTEAKKLAFEDRAKFYADPEFGKLPVQDLISKAYAKKRQSLIDVNRAAKRYDPGQFEAANTIYLTVADKEGNMVSLIQSNYRGMGSGMVAPGLGFMFQDRGEMFSMDSKHLNALEPNKRPFHTIIPGFITKDGIPWVSYGVMGGGMQPQGHAQIVINLVDFKMNLQEAGDAPRIQHIGSSEPTGEQMLTGGELLLESGFPYDVIRNLLQKGHKIGFEVGSFGGYQAIMWDPIRRVYFGASESRKDGQAVGY